MEKKASIKVHIREFKSLSNVYINLSPLTIIIGPPASGKSALLEAIGIIGYFLGSWLGERLGYYWDLARSRPLNKVVRGNSCIDLLDRYSKAGEFMVKMNNINIKGLCKDPYRLESQVYTNGLEASLEAKYPEAEITSLKFQEAAEALRGEKEAGSFLAFFAALLKGLQASGMEELVKVIDEHIIPGNYILYYPRLYGFDRLGAVINIMEGRTGSRFPPFLEPDASNLGSLLYANYSLLKRLNDILKDITGVTVEPLHNGKLAFKDGNLDVGPSSISDSVLRLIYGVTALLSSERETRSFKTGEGQVKVEVSHIIMLEEPEAHMYPVAYSELADIVSDSINKNHNTVIITTHSGRLAETLFEKVKAPVAVYYMLRDKKTKTSKIYKIDLQKTAKRLLDMEDIIHLPTHDINELVRDGALIPTRHRVKSR